MTQREKLVELLNKQVGYTLPIWTAPQAIEIMADALIANGVIVPPCNTGDEVYLIKQKCKYSGDKNEPWNSCEHYWDNVYKRGMWGCAGKDKNGKRFECKKKEREWYIQPLGFSLSYLEDENIVLEKNLFLTKEEAEKALAEKRADNG